ncbi:Smr/MutS family protein [Bradyrhizobium sp. LHD-71]|uniref:Smr/MutS family protein n=1 Tax=Bradyrhizobium sp. LHD-71 TaxID=3072141 RepID=UPI00280FD658|nr:Smr/MutS family protein [Bradyrhizobium sp. LHD-71]MDQ8732653.1 Smr/MutS family protein [Bradyrhizobium sp. LHD-71]
MRKVLPAHGRKRALSEEEKALWHAVAKSTTPLRRRKRIVPDDVESDAAEAIQQPSRSIKPAAVRRSVAPVAQPSLPPLAPLGRRQRSRLAKGRNQIDARLDLHGMTQARAHRTLTAFLQRAHGDGATFVLIITGKGRASAAEGERGILRRQVPLWLGLPELRSLIVGFEEAHIGHGGEGALYVRLRRTR